MEFQNILITGAGGFVGSCLARRLLETTPNLHKLILLYHNEKPPLVGIDRDNVILVHGSINDYALMSELIAKYEISTIYHMASNAIVRKCANDPYNAYVTNVMGTVTLLEAVRNVGMNNIKKIVISTSDKVYGHAPSPYNENTLFMPQYTYEATKACQDFVAQNYFFNYNLPINIVRSSNIYGPNDPNLSRVIPLTIKSIHNGKQPTIYSGAKDYVREFVYIDDFIDAVLLIAEKAKPGEAFCVGETHATSVENLITTICNLMEFKPGPVTIEKNDKFKEIKEQKIDATKLKGLGWKPKVTFEEGLRNCINSPLYA